MLRGQQERTFQLCQGFLEMFQKGHSHKEIAEHFHVSESTVYRCLGPIAKMHGVSRESLLYRPHSPHASSHRIGKPIKIGFGRELLNELNLAITDANNVLESLDEYISYEILDLRSVVEYVNKFIDR